MPMYSFHCNDCGHTFEQYFYTMDDRKVPPCPECKSKKVTRQLGTVTFTKKSSSKGGGLPRFGFG